MEAFKSAEASSSAKVETLKITYRYYKIKTIYTYININISVKNICLLIFEHVPAKQKNIYNYFKTGTVLTF